MAQKISKIGKKIEPELKKALTDPQQGKNSPKMSFFKQWSGVTLQALTDYKEEPLS